MYHKYQIFGDEYRRKRLYLFGESYAGYYVPSLAHKIYQRNQERKQQQQENDQEKEPHIPLHGIALGNGWVNSIGSVESDVDLEILVAVLPPWVKVVWIALVL